MSRRSFVALVLFVCVSAASQWRGYSYLKRETNTVSVATEADGFVSNANYNYVEAIQKVITFYDVQRAGVMSKDNRLNWRGDSLLNDGKDNNVDLTGGFTDAGDNIKFGFPMAAMTCVLGWGAYYYPDTLTSSGQRSFFEANFRWATDYFIKAHSATNTLWGQVGNGNADHAFWGAQEVVDAKMTRPSYKVDQNCPGSDLAGSTASALAWGSILFKTSDPTYSNTLLTHAKQLYTFAETYLGKYTDCITDAQAYYNSWSGYWDELVEGACVLYIATSDKAYLTKAENYYAKLSVDQSGVKSYKWTHSWDDKSYGSYVLLATLTGNSTYAADANRWLDWWTDGYQGNRVPYTPAGLAYLDTWGPLRYAATTAFVAQVWADYISTSDPTRSTKYNNFAKAQIDYTLGSNPNNLSYLVAFGTKYPKNIHHRTCHSSWDDNINDPVDDRHDCLGSLVGGPSSDDSFVDDRQQYQHTEPACDYASGLFSALLGLAKKYGGTPVSGWPKAETPGLEIYVAASLNNAGNDFTEIRALMTNQAGWPARVETTLSLKYFLNLTATVKAGIQPSQVNVTLGYNVGAHLTYSTVQAYDASNNIYFVAVDWNGQAIYPGGQSQYHAEAQFRMGIPDTSPAGAWDPSHDWSYQGIQKGDPVLTDYIPVYQNGVLIYGKEPPKSL